MHALVVCLTSFSKSQCDALEGFSSLCSSCHEAAFCYVSVQVSSKELHALLTKTSLEGIPLLVLGNKNDLPGALGTQQLIDRMQLQVCRGAGASPACEREHFLGQSLLSKLQLGVSHLQPLLGDVLMR